MKRNLVFEVQINISMPNLCTGNKNNSAVGAVGDSYNLIS